MILSGDEVILRPLAGSDAPALAEAAGESRETYQFNPVPKGVDDARRYIERAMQQRDRGERIPFTIVWRDRVVGSTSFANMETWRWPAGHPHQREAKPDVVEIGYTWLAQSAQRTRCNTEAKFLLLSHAFEVWRVHRVSFRTDVRNERSRRAIERLGAKFEGVRRADMPSVDGSVRDSAFFSIVSDEWPDIKLRLLGLLGRGAD